MTNETNSLRERCNTALACLPQAEYRERLAVLFNDLLACGASGRQGDLIACANCGRPKCEHNGILCPRPFTTHWHAWDYKFAQPEFPEYKATADRSALQGAPTPPAETIAWVIPGTGQFSWDKQNERYWTPLVRKEPAVSEAVAPEAKPDMVLVPRELPDALVTRIANHGVWEPQEIKNLHADICTQFATPPAPPAPEAKPPAEQIKELLDIQGRHGNWNYDPYMQGMYNGMELALATLEDREPVFKTKPADGWCFERAATPPAGKESAIVQKGGGETHPNSRYLFNQMCYRFGVVLGVDTVPTALKKIAALSSPPALEAATYDKHTIDCLVHRITGCDEAPDAIEDLEAAVKMLEGKTILDLLNAEHDAALSAQAAPADAWKDAVLEELGKCCMDAPLSEPPASILRRVIDWNCQVATDPAVSGTAPADYPPPVSKEQLLQDLGYFSPSLARLRDAPEWQRHDRLRRFIEQSGRERVSAVDVKWTGTLHWKGVPVAAEQAEDSAMLDWLEKHFTVVRGVFVNDKHEVVPLNIDCGEDTMKDNTGKVRAAIRAAMTNREAGRS